MERGSGDSNVKVAVEVRRWNVASSINLGAFGSLSSSSSSGSRLGFLGGVSLGVGMEMVKLERAVPRRGWWGMLPEWVRRVMVVLKPAVC